MDKLSAQKTQRLMAHARDLMVKAAEAIEERDRIIEQYRQKEAAASVFDAMQEKNISPTWATSQDEAVQQFMSMPAEKQAAIRMAVELAAPQHPLAGLDNQNDSVLEGGRIKGASAFEQYVMDNIS